MEDAPVFKKYIETSVGADQCECLLHSFRHLFASLLVNQGVDIVTVSGALGHSTVSTTSNIYCHMLDEARAKVSEAVSSALDFSGSKKEPGGE